MDILEKLEGVLDEGDSSLIKNRYTEETKVCNNCKHYDEESNETFGACLLVFPKGVKDENYMVFKNGVQNYGVCNKFSAGDK